ncbi:DUF5305 domain-containing protein [Halorubrum ezzemoulense]|uniref:DUF5305 domain-containing protein n=1 Tax=Halorubrum ezzemoulense TaxID=337243 RepID=UPI00232CD48F|nr:DUF5305 domain-containing protein [Halorubrum ezzemoulense]MDB9252876.1 DUF5305 domain-containing protein [Halorubrum ezzemoulense]
MSDADSDADGEPPDGDAGGLLDRLRGALSSEDDGADDEPSANPSSDGPTTEDADRIRAVARRHLSIGDRALLAKYLPLIVVACLLIAAGGGYLAYDAQTAPDTRTETRPAGSWTVESGFEHGAEVVNGTSVFPAGTRLENRSLYFTELAPTLGGEYVVTHRGEVESATGTVELRLVTEAIDESSASGQGQSGPTVYWRETDPLATEDIEGLAPGESHRVAFEVNTTAVSERIAEIESELGASPGTTRVSVVARTDLEAEVAGQRFVDGRTDRLDIEPGAQTYSVERDVSPAGTYDASRTVAVSVEPSPLKQYGGLLLMVLGTSGAVLTGTAIRRNSISVRDHEQAQLDYARTRSDLDQWISTGTVPGDDDERTVVELNSLRDLVNVAIDSDRRVIERSDARPRFVVLDDDVRYVFDPPPAVTGDAQPDTQAGVSPHDSAPTHSSAYETAPTDERDPYASVEGEDARHPDQGS